MRFLAAVADTSLIVDLPWDVNLPNDTATVTVQDTPGTCRSNPTSGTLDSWLVTIDGPFVATLYKAASGRNPDLHSGQYHMPFQLLIKAKTCLKSNGYLL